MSYMLLILEDTQQRGTRTEAEGKAVYDSMVEFGKDLTERGLLEASASLSSPSNGARVTVRQGRVQVLDGPFAEAKEMVGGFFLLKCKTWAEAMSIAEQCPAAQWATVELRTLGPCYEQTSPTTVRMSA